MHVKHTPGPWHVEADLTVRSRFFDSSQMGDYRGVIVADLTAGLGHPAEGSSREHARPEADANARLIAAAPDLLEAARMALAALPQVEAIARKIAGADAVSCVPAADALRAAITKAEGMKR